MIAGPPGAGKSTVATALLQRFALGLHIPVDDLREWVVSGIAHPVPNWTEETSRQFSLARAAAVQTAQIYANAGFAVVIDDIVSMAEATALYAEPLQHYAVHYTLLLPTLDTVLARNAQRRTKAFDTRMLDSPIRSIHRWMADQDAGAHGWQLIDTSILSVEETVHATLQHAEQRDRERSSSDGSKDSEIT